jgi:type IV secretory pathway VirB2 component (pilin)
MNLDVDGSGNNVVAAAVNWLEATLLGSLATAVAVIVIASFGLLLFLGRVPTRRAIEVLFGCFILFGASSIASGVMRSIYGPGTEPHIAEASPSSPPIEAPVQAHSPQPYEPYTGAAVPRRH